MTLTSRTGWACAMSDLTVHDFAAALRQMADNADRVADRHDIAKMARLQDLALTLKNQAQRDAGLIAELRRQAASMARSLDGIARAIVKVDGDDVKILADALLLISEGFGCRNFTGSHSCRDDSSGKDRRSPYGADAWCSPCIARDALERAGWTDGT